MLERVRERMFEVLEVEEIVDLPSRAFNAFIVLLIFLNVLAVMVETVRGINPAWHRYLGTFETFSVAVFTIEYLLRLWVCTRHMEYKRPVVGRIRYALRFMPLVDLIAILPFYLPMVFALDLRFVRALRLFRLLRLFKVGRYSKALTLIVRVFRTEREELGVAAFMAAIVFSIASALMYHLEHKAQPEVFSSIFATMWWTVSALTPMSAGVVPITQGGKILAGFVAVFGLALFALPAGILASGFSRAVAENREGLATCPRCGFDLSRARRDSSRRGTSTRAYRPVDGS